MSDVLDTWPILRCLLGCISVWTTHRYWPLSFLFSFFLFYFLSLFLDHTSVAPTNLYCVTQSFLFSALWSSLALDLGVTHFVWFGHIQMARLRTNKVACPAPDNRVGIFFRRFEVHLTLKSTHTGLKTIHINAVYKHWENRPPSVGQTTRKYPQSPWYRKKMFRLLRRKSENIWRIRKFILH